MYLHANAKLGLAGRLALVRAVEDGVSLKAGRPARTGRAVTRRPGGSTRRVRLFELPAK